MWKFRTRPRRGPLFDRTDRDAVLARAVTPALTRAALAEIQPLEPRWLLSVAAATAAGDIPAHAAIRTASTSTSTTVTAADKKKKKAPGPPPPPPAAGAAPSASPADAGIGADGTLTVNGTAGDDTIIVSTNGTTTTVSINGSAADFADSTFSHLVINGLAGDDSITLTDGVIGSTLNGGDGNDTLVGGSGADVFSGGRGVDAVDYSARTTDLVLNLGGGATSGANGGAEGDNILNDVENAVGGSGNDLIAGNAADNILAGGAGDDTLLGNDGDDTLIGNAGNDTLDGKNGADLMEGGAGFDAADYRFRTEDLTLQIDGRPDSGNNGGNEGDTISTDIERIVGGSGDDLIVGDNAGNSLDARDGNDTVIGGTGNDSIDGGNGNDSLVGGDGNDVLTGQAGNDTMLGGNGDDDLIANDGQSDLVDGGAGNDTAQADAGLDIVTNVETGTGLSLPDINVTDTTTGTALSDNFSTVDFGTVNQGAEDGPTHTFTITNPGSSPLDIVGNVTVPTGFILIDTPASVVAVGGSTTFTIELDPSIVGAKNGQISFATNVPNQNPFNFTLVGNVVVPQLPTLTVLSGATPLANGARVSFGSTTTGTPVSKTFTVRNDGVGTLTLGSVSVPAGFSVTDPLAASLGPGASDTFTVQLDASAVGAPGGPITFTSNDPNAPSFSIAIAGAVAAAPAPVVGVSQGTTDIPNNSTSPIEFGNVIAGQAAPSLTFTISNAGNARLRLANFTLPGGFTLVTPPPTSVAPGGSATFVVQLNGSAAVGDYTGQISFATNDPANNPFTFTVHGTVVSSAEPAVNLFTIGRRGRLLAVGGGQTIGFGQALVGVRAPSLTFEVRNGGTARLYVGQITLPDGFVLAAAPRVTRLNPGGAVTFTVALSTATAASRGGTVSIATNAPGGPFTFNVTGSVITPAPAIAVSIPRARRRAVAAVAGGSVSFGSVVRRGAAPTMTFIVSNVGTGAMRTSAITVPNGFVVAKGLARYIYPGGSDTLVVQMGTRAIGSYGGDLAIYSSDAAHSPYTMSISGSVIPATVGTPGGGGGGSGVTALMDGGTLTVTGTDGADDILVGGSVRAVTVTANGQTVAGGPFAGVSKIVVDAGAGNDRVTVTVPINSTLNGDDDNDTLTGGPGNDVLNGGAGDDVLNGGDGNDALNGGDGNDALTGGPGIDAMRGESGNDAIDASDGIADSLVDGGPGTDSINKDRVDPWTRT